MTEFKSDMQIVDHPQFNFKRDTDFSFYPYVRLEPKDSSGLIATYSKRFPVHLRDEKTGIVLPQSVNLHSSVTLNEAEYEAKKLTISLNDYQPILTSEIIQTFISYASLRFQCVGCAENLNHSLRDALVNYYNLIGENKRSDLLRADFNGLRDMLSPIIQKDQSLHKIPFFDTLEKRKKYTSTFFNFIADRNIFTHGILYYNTDDNEMYLHYINKEKKIDSWAKLTDEILQSYFWVSEQLRNPLSAMNDTFNILRNQRIKQ